MLHEHCRRIAGRLFNLAGPLVLCASVAIAGQPRDVETLMSLLAQIEHVSAEYSETRESSLLSVPISTKGWLEYRAPDRIVMSSDKDDRFEIDGDRLRVFSNGKKVQELVVSEHRPLAALVVALKAVFAGDLQRLRKDYRLGFRASEGRWSLDLVPGAATATPLTTVTRIGIAGSGAAIEQIELTESDGDKRRLRMRILERSPSSLP